MRGIDLVMAFPYILLALGIVAVLGPGLMNALYAVTVVNVPFFAHSIRGLPLGLSRREFVDAARLRGASPATVLLAEVDRKSVVEGKGVSVGVRLGGGRFIQKTIITT